jgi:Protein of unknown function (DUF3352)
MGSRRTLRILAAAALSVGVVTLFAGALWMIGSASGQRERFSSLEIAPADSVFYMAINTEPSSSQWIAVSDTLGRLNAKDPLREAIDKELLQFGLQFERDILPLAGDEGYIAITDVDALIAEDGGFVAAFRLRDPAKAEEITLSIAESEGTEFTEEVYEGVTIRQSKGTAANNYQDEGALSFVNEVMIVGGVPDDVKGVIDVIQGRAANALTDDRLREMRERQEEDFLVWGYADLSRVWDVIEEQIKQGQTPYVPDFDLEQLMGEARANDRLSFSVSSQGDGFVADASVLLAPGAEIPPGYGSTVFNPQFASAVPAETLFFYAGFDLYNGYYVPLRDTLEKFRPEGSGQTIQQELNTFEEEIGFDLENDLLSLLTGEYAVAFNASDIESTEPVFSLLALLEVNDPARIDETMGKVEDFLERSELAAVEDSETEGIRRWSVPNGLPEAVAWTLDEDRLAVGYPEAAVEEFAAGVPETLADTEDWKRTMELMPDDKTSLMFVSLSRILDEVRKSQGADEAFGTATENKVTLDDLGPIRSVSMASTLIEGGYGFRIAVFIAD